jgi:hypothetical protein
MKSYLSTLKSLKITLKDRYVLFDNDAIVSILSFEAQELMEEFSTLQVTNCYIQPVYIELMRHGNEKERFKRQEFLDKYPFTLLPIHETAVSNSLYSIQPYLHSLNIHPSVTDLYLGARLGAFEHSGKIFVLTSNLCDFPSPLFKRESAIILQNNKSVKVLSILSFNHEVLPYV